MRYLMGVLDFLWPDFQAPGNSRNYGASGARQRSILLKLGALAFRLLDK